MMRAIKSCNSYTSAPAAAAARCLAPAAGLCLAALLSPVWAAAYITIVDDFERAPLDEARWSLYRMAEQRHWIDRRVVRDGRGALAIRVKGNDFDPTCSCQISEVREAPERRLNFGDEAWYAFSFRIDGRPPRTGDQRWQIGSWKQETSGSPFVAQRFDSGVFHITIESGDTRVLVASSEGEVNNLLDLLKDGIASRFAFLSEPARFAAGHDITIEYGDDSVLPDPRAGWVDMIYRIKGGLNGDGLVEVHANGRFIARARGTIGVRDMVDPSQYFRIGHNRSPMTATATLYVDRFRRGATRADVEK